MKVHKNKRNSFFFGGTFRRHGGHITLYWAKLSFAFAAAGTIMFLWNREMGFPSNDAELPLIPRPLSVEESDGPPFRLTSRTGIIVPEGMEEMIGQYLADLLAPALGYRLSVETSSTKQVNSNVIAFVVFPAYDKELSSEGYELETTNNGITIAANEAAGFFYAVQTLRQLLPAAVEARTQQPGPWAVPLVRIRDYPAYSYRGTMLDISRHFFPVEIIKRNIDFLASFKMNHFHLHLSDDQGWRIEIKKWPELTATGGSTQVGGGKGGFFTQDEYKEIVQYAAERFITVVPEIDMPGHTNSALASYAELNCDDQATELYTATKVGFSSLCTTKEVTYTFLDDVIAEVAAVTPGPYLHIGGDESWATEKDDYILFIDRVKDIVRKHGKTMIGWDDIAEADLDENVVVQFWNEEHAPLARRGAERGAKLIMSPANKAYLDMKYGVFSRIGLKWAGYIKVHTGYDWDLETCLPGVGKRSILGIEAPLWTETVTNMDDIGYLTFPRLLGYAEIGWTPNHLRKWKTYRIRLGQFKRRMELMGIKFYRSYRVPWKDK